MKIQYIIALVLSSSVVNSVLAEEAVASSVKSAVIDTGWVNQDPSATCPETHYPVQVEIMPLKGDGARYKAIFIPKPKDDFEYKSILGMRTEAYEKLNEELLAKGYVQISHQVATIMIGNVHQAVWVSRKKEADAPKN